MNGVSTTHYRATVDLNKEAASVRAKAGDKAAAVITRQEQALGTHTLPVDVWVGADHLVRQYRTQVPIPPSSSGGPAGSGTVALTMAFSDFGAPVTVTPPPSSEVADVTNQVSRPPGRPSTGRSKTVSSATAVAVRRSRGRCRNVETTRWTRL